MKNGVGVAIGVVEIVSALGEAAGAVLDGRPETKPDLSRLFARILAAMAGMRGA
jgi:hypothetical protein